MNLLRFVPFLLIATLLCSVADARPAKISPQALAQAKAAFKAATADYDAGHFEDAMTGFEHAHELSRNPVLYFNLAACAEKLGQTRVASTHLRAYLAEVPNADDALKVRERIGALEERAKHEDEQRADEERRAQDEALRRKHEEEQRALAPAVVPTPTHEADQPKVSIGHRYAGGFAALGATALFGIVAAGLGGSAIGKYNSLDGECGATGCGDRVDPVQHQAIAADVFMGLTGAAAVTTVVLFVLESRKGHTQAHARAATVRF